MPIDWAAVLQRTSDPGDRAALDTLRRLDAFRGGPSPGTALARPHQSTTVLRTMVLIGAAQTMLALLHLASAAATGELLTGFTPHTALVGVFVAASLLLGSAVPRDHRVFFLLAMFTLTACAFARPLLAAGPHTGTIASSVLFRGLYPEAFAQAALWQFAAVFPSVRRFTGFDLFARRAASAACALAAGLFLVNLLLEYGMLTGPLGRFARDHEGNLFWQLFAGAALPALITIVIRAWRAPWRERVKAVRFACAISAGSVPILAVGVARTVPPIDSWMRTLGISPWADAGVLSALTAMPILATLAVLADAPFELQRIGRPGDGGWIARSVQRVDAVRARLVRPRRHRQRLSMALDRVRLARGSREIRAVLQQELQGGAGAGTVAILDAGLLPAGTALRPLLDESSGLVDLSRLGEPFVLLPPRDREWLDLMDVALAAAVRLREGTIPVVILLGNPPGKDAFDRSARWFIMTLLTGASAAWDAAGPPAPEDECADECPQCGRVHLAGTSTCCGRAETRLAALPGRLGDRFIVVRRLGAGGMGVVYLGHDLTLGRDVALKTWAGLRGELMARLHEEARLMATLNHDALATIYGLERWRGTPVLVMEYCTHGTLADVMSRGTLNERDVLHVGLRLTDGLTYMHGRGVLHRDIKPSNIGFTADGVAKLLDFGLAGADEQPGGTLAYLPPEALDGAPPDVAVDLWGLATVLREACGDPAAHPPPLDAFFRRALARRPADRFQSSLEMHAALARLPGE